MGGVKLEPDCVKVNAIPAMVNVPLRALLPVLAATEYATVPLLLPAAPEVTVIQLALLTAVQAQPAVDETVIVPLNPVAATDWLVDERE